MEKMHCGQETADQLFRPPTPGWKYTWGEGGGGGGGKGGVGGEFASAPRVGSGRKLQHGLVLNRYLETHPALP